MKIIKTIMGSFSEALAEGAVMLPNLMFVGLYYEHYGQTDYIMPFVLLYAFEKAGPFLLSGFGKVKNLYLVWLLGNVIAIAGCVMLFLGSAAHILWNVGAILVGLGLSCFGPTYRTMRDEIRELKIWSVGASLNIGYLILLAYLWLVMGLRYINMNIVIAAILGMVCISTVQCIVISKQNPYKGERIFVKRSLRIDQFVLGIFVLLLTFVIRLYKQTAGVGLVLWIVAVMLFFAIAVYITKRSSYRGHSLRTLWYGAERNFVTIFSLIYFMAIGEYGKVTVAYTMIGFGVVLSRIVSPLLKKKIPREKYEAFCIIAASVCSVLMLIPGSVPYMLGVLLAVIFISAGNSVSTSLYLQDKRFDVNERRLVCSRFYGLGAVVEQAFMMSFFFLFSYMILGNGTDALSAYTYREGDISTGPVYFYSLLACIALNTVGGVMIAGYKEE